VTAGPGSDRDHALEVEIHARTRWWHEDDLISQRLSWLLNAHAIVGAGYAWLRHRMAEVATEIAAQSDARLPLLAYRGQLSVLADALWWIGVCVSVFVLLGIVAAIVAQRRLARDYQARGYAFTLGVSTATTDAGAAVAVALPLVCVAGWLLVDAALR
jgi:hypothetical protein